MEARRRADRNASRAVRAARRRLGSWPVLLGSTLLLACGDAGGDRAAAPVAPAATPAAPAATPGVVYLTFDDGPIDATFAVLDVLARHGVEATFFVNGFHLFGEGDENETRALAALQRTLEDGHVVGNHSYDHMLHNCCEDGACGAAVCNRVARWNVGAYRDPAIELASFLPTNVDEVRALLPAGASHPNDHLTRLARLPYTNAWRAAGLRADCPCCTFDDVAQRSAPLACAQGRPTASATVAARVADELAARGFEVWGWDLEWSPADWGATDAVSTLTDGDRLADQVVAAMTACTATTMEPAISRALDFPCDDGRRRGRVIVLTHDFLFEDGKRGRGAAHNLPKLDRFLTVMLERGYRFDTLDRYGGEERDPRVAPPTTGGAP
jgi:chitin disaccharide deacetylase